MTLGAGFSACFSLSADVIALAPDTIQMSAAIFAARRHHGLRCFWICAAVNASQNKAKAASAAVALNRHGTA